MICEKCGAPIEEGSAFCTNCGNKVGQPAPAAQPDSAQFAPVQPDAQPPVFGDTVQVKKKSPAKIIIPIAAAVLVVIIAVVAVILIVLGKSSPKKVISDYYDAFNKYDAEQLSETYADFYADYFYDIYGETLSEDCEDTMESASEKELSVEYEITEVRNVEPGSIVDVREELYAYYGNSTYDEEWFDVHVTNAALVHVEGKYEFKGEEDDSETYTIDSDLLALKVDGIWKYVPFDIFEGFFED